MPHTLPMLTLQEMQKTSIEDLRKIGDSAECRFYGQACNQMAWAQVEYNLARAVTVTVARHIKMAKDAYAKAMELETVRVMITAQDIKERGDTVETGTFYGSQYHTSRQETYKNDQIRGHGYRR